MAWKELSVSEQRLVLAHRVVELQHPLAVVAREMKVSRKTGYKWVQRYRADRTDPMTDHSRRPRRSPGRTGDAVEQRVLGWRDQYGWGPRKIHRLMQDEQPQQEQQQFALPSVRTIATILRRHGRVVDSCHTTQEPAADQRFERPGANQLWQTDHKGPIEIAKRKYCPLVILDDHSRYCLRLALVADKTMNAAWAVLWELFAEVGMPESILSDNAFGAWGIGLSWFDAQLVRLNINPIHGRPYHPQTQGKVERFNGTMERELLAMDHPSAVLAARRDCLEHFNCDSEQWRRLYNTLRPHEALGDAAPASRWMPSQRPRPAELPPVQYPAGSILRKVTQVGDVYWFGRRILVGRSLERQTVRIEDRGAEIAIYYCWKQIRVLSPDQLGPARCYKLI